MSSGNSHVKPTLTLEARKHLLLVACTIDRLDLITKSRPPPTAGEWFSQLASTPWFETAASVAERMLPRKLRLLTMLWRTWSNSRRTR